MNVVVLEYEEKIQRSASEISQLQEKLAMQTSRNDANIDAYRRVCQTILINSVSIANFASVTINFYPS